MIAEVDAEHFSEKDLVEVKVPMSLPYLRSSDTYERVDGEIAMNGLHYNYVKRKMFKDTLYLLCLPNFAKSALYKSKADYTQDATNLPIKKSNETSAKKGNCSSDYNYQITSYVFCIPLTPFVLPSSSRDILILSRYISFPEQPPELSC